MLRALGRVVAKKMACRLRKPFSWLTTEGACVFCISIVDTGGGYGRGVPLKILKFAVAFDALWCNLGHLGLPTIFPLSTALSILSFNY